MSGSKLFLLLYNNKIMSRLCNRLIAVKQNKKGGNPTFPPSKVTFIGLRLHL
ncbi:hypothetical protein HMPREF0766_11706 [Sphingobacterium spiritivorum ATCC 33861]|uniref:Uncharacterized protein n=1 Tax=Sphingobacterium spiritivorum ATCC 33861 TaxID=525373 RepID=D7VL37_SPHSI|nr:hypothetical protein HMPREF0766_11706 [Sphingobacterium spiritivorum ATCC 33861]